MPGQELVEPRDLVIGDAAENIGEPSLRIDAVQLGGLDQRIGDGRGFATALRKAMPAAAATAALPTS